MGHLSCGDWPERHPAASAQGGHGHITGDMVILGRSCCVSTGGTWSYHGGHGHIGAILLRQHRIAPI